MSMFDILVITALTDPQCARAMSPLIVNALCAVSMLLFLESDSMQFKDYTINTLPDRRMRIDFRDALPSIDVDHAAVEQIRRTGRIRNLSLCSVNAKL